MAFSQQLLHASTLICGTRKHPVTATIKRGVPIGTGFTVLFRGEADSYYPYLVTADHVVPKSPETVTLLASHPDGKTRTIDVPESDWWRPFAGVDLAIASLDRAETHDLGWPSLEIERQSFPLNYMETVGLGSVLHYAGLLVPMDIPMGRSGTLGNLYQEVGGTKKYPWKYRAHLMDCRSYGGFSGSPVYIEIDYPVMGNGTMNPDLAKMVPMAVRDLSVSRIVQVTPLFGMLTAHLDDKRFNSDDDGDEFTLASRHGVGIVLPVEVILAGLNCEKLRMDRKRKDAEAAEKDEGPPIVGASRRKPKRDMDERVSLYPLTGEEALKGLLETPPPDDGS